MSATPHAPARVDRRILKTKQALFNALLRLLHTQHVEEIAVSRLCELADVNRSSFYKYYSTPIDILREKENELSRQLYQNWTQYRSQGLREAILHQMTELQQMQDFLRLILGPHGPTGFMSRFAGDARAQGAAHLRTVFPGMTQTQAEYLFVFWMKAAQGLTEQWLLDGCTQPPEVIADMISHACLYGMQGYGRKPL